MFIKSISLCFLVLTPMVFSFTLPTNNAVVVKESEVQGRQFHDEPIINYGIWGFIAGLIDYGIRWVNNNFIFDI